MSTTEEEFLFPDPAPLGLTVYLVVHNTVHLLLLMYVVTMLGLRRRHKYISPRTVATLIPLHIFFYAYTLTSSLSIIFGKPDFCLALNILTILLPSFGLHFNLNIPTLVYHSDLNEVKVDRANGNLDAPVWRMLKFVSLKAKFAYMLITLAMQIGIALLIIYATPLAGDCLRPSLVALAIHLILYMVLLSYYLVRLSKVVDPFYMRFENNLGTVFNIIQIFFMISYPLGPGMYPSWFDYRWSIICGSAVSITVDGLFPVLLTFPSFSTWLDHRVKKSLFVTDSEIMEMDQAGMIYALNHGQSGVFEAVLINPILLEAFTRFCVVEWCAENVLFYLAVAKFKELYNEPGSQIRAMDIIREYIVTGAPIEVNLDETTKKAILTAAGLTGRREAQTSPTIPREIFDRAQSHIFHLMEEDTFGKWKKTGEFKEALMQVVRERTASAGRSH